jgi:hypothetical protein
MDSFAQSSSLESLLALNDEANLAAEFDGVPVDPEHSGTGSGYALCVVT